VDKIVIRDLEVQAHVGVTDEERRKPQRLLVSVEIEADTRTAGHTDSEAATISYLAMAEMVQKIARDKTYRLIEALAEDIASGVLVRFMPPSVTVEVKKFTVPKAQYAAVQITRER
jgi:dihydroneopterin aldolase